MPFDARGAETKPARPASSLTMRRPLAIVGLVLFACGPSHATTSMSPSPSVAISPTPHAYPSGIADLPVSKLDLSCRLPIVTSPVEGTGDTFHGGFITF